MCIGKLSRRLQKEREGRGGGCWGRGLGWMSLGVAANPVSGTQWVKQQMRGKLWSLGQELEPGVPAVTHSGQMTVAAQGQWLSNLGGTRPAWRAC